MSMRIFSVCLPVLLLVGCGGAPADTTGNTPLADSRDVPQEDTLHKVKRWVKGEAPPAPDTRPRIVCAPAGRTEFQDDCRLERIASQEGEDLVLHKPDGSFRRVKVVQDGNGLVAADGLVRAQVKPQPPEAIELVMGGDRFVLPATLKARATPAAP
jgi:hypothetical protein